MKTEKSEASSRRDFLKLAATTAPAAAVLTVTGEQAAAEVAEDTGTGLRKTPHTEAYLKSARF